MVEHLHFYDYTYYTHMHIQAFINAHIFILDKWEQSISLENSELRFLRKIFPIVLVPITTA